MNHVRIKWAPLKIYVFLMFQSFPIGVTRASSRNSFLNKISQISRPPNLRADTLPGRLLSFLPPSNRCLFNAFDVRGSNRNSPGQIFPFSKYFLLCFPSPSIFLFFPLCSSPSLGKYSFYFFLPSFPRRNNYFLFLSKCSLPFLSLFPPLRINYFPWVKFTLKISSSFLE